MPEFLAEGSAINDLVNPQRVVIGTDNDFAYEIISSLSPKNCKIIRTNNCASSELGKLMSNALLAQRISSVNSMTELCEKTKGASMVEVKQIIQADDRIGCKYL